LSRASKLSASATILSRASNFNSRSFLRSGRPRGSRRSPGRRAKRFAPVCILKDLWNSLEPPSSQK
jgi:hypothetical protein